MSEAMNPNAVNDDELDQVNGGIRTINTVYKRSKKAGSAKASSTVYNPGKDNVELVNLKKDDSSLIGDFPTRSSLKDGQTLC